jgi:enoyl-CoA hydratase
MVNDCEYSTISIDIKGKVSLVRLNRPEALNALNFTLLSELMDSLEFFDTDEQIGAVVITGGDKAFAAGADITEMAEASAVEMYQSKFIPQFDRIRNIRKPLIAAVSGWCLGGGNELAMACDLIIASETAKFGQPEINLGVIPGAGGTQRLTHAVGKAVAMEMVLNNRTLNAEEALHYGLVNYVFPLDEYLSRAMSLAEEIGSRAPMAVQIGKEAVNLAFETNLSRGLIDERRAFNFLFTTDDQQEGMSAFIEKRNPEWKGK